MALLQSFLWVCCSILTFCLADRPELVSSSPGHLSERESYRYRPVETCDVQSESCTPASSNDGFAMLQVKTRRQGAMHPVIQEYIRYLEALEAEGPSALLAKTVRDIPAATDDGTVAFIVMSDSNNYGTRLKWISESWGKDVPPSRLFAIGDGENNRSDMNVRVEATRCPPHTHDGACCKMAEAILLARKLVATRPKLQWAYIVDDDAYVRPNALAEHLKTVDPLGTNQKGAMAAISGCASPQCPYGFCGGGGAALSREALTSLVGESPATYLKEHMKTCGICEMWGDITLGTTAHTHGVSVYKLPGLNGWLMPKNVFDMALAGAEPLMYHYIKTEGQQQFLHHLFSKPVQSSSNTLQDKPLYELQDHDPTRCATYKGNLQCSTDTKALPWGPV